MEKFKFVTSNRFIALVIGAVVFYLRTKGFVGEPETLLVETILGGFIAIRTVDRVGEKIGGVEN